MKPPKYANATPAGGDNNIVSNDIVSTNDIELYLTLNITNNIVSNDIATNDIVSSDTVSSDIGRKRAREEIAKTLGRMTPAYRSAVKRNREDPLSYRIEKVLRRARPRLGNDRYMQLVGELSKREPIEQAQLCEQLETWIEKSATGGA